MPVAKKKTSAKKTTTARKSVKRAPVRRAVVRETFNACGILVWIFVCIYCEFLFRVFYRWNGIFGG